MNKSKQVIRVDKGSTKKVKVSKYDSKQVASIVGGILGVIAFLAICIIIGYDSFHKDPVLVVNGEKYYITDPEVKFSVYMGEASLQNTSANYAAYYGMDASTYYDTYLSQAKANALSSMEEYMVMYLEAVENNEELSDEDKTETEENYGKIYDKMTSARKKALDMSREEFIEQALRIKLASQYMETLTESYNITEETLSTPIDKTQYDERSFEVIQVALTTTDSDNEEVDVSDDDKSTYKKQMESYLKEAQKGTEMSEIVSEDDSATYTYTTKSLLTTDTTYTELMATISDMKDGEVYDSVIEADGYYWIVKMTDNDITTQYDSAVSSEISSEQSTKLDEDIEAAKEKYGLTEEKGWDAVDFGSVVVEKGDELPEFAEDEEETEATATPEATDDASASPEATEDASATPEATEEATATPAN